MKREAISAVIGGIDERHIAEAAQFEPARCAPSPERIEHMKTKRLITLALAAALILSLSIAAYATYSAVGTPQAAEKVAREQIEVWKEMGLINPEIFFEGEATQIVELPEQEGGAYWYGRFFPHSYDVRWYGGKYGCNLRVDTLSGKIMNAFLDARPDEGREPVREETIEMEKGHPETWSFYDNFEDLVPADMTVDCFCSLLAEYWGFSGYTIADTVDSFYDEHWPAVDGSTLLIDLPSGNTNYYLTVFFEGDQDGVPRYIQLNQFAGYVDLSFGTGHTVG